MSNLVVGPPDPDFPTLPPIPEVPPAVPGVNVMFSKDIQKPPEGQNISVSTTGSWAGSVYGGIADAVAKFFTMIVSPMAGYAKQTFYGEAAMDFNGKGGLVAGFTGVARGFGKTNKTPGAVNDVVGYNGVAFKDTDCWAAGLHGEVRDSVAGGVAIGVNAEIVSLEQGTRGIGVHALNWGGNAAAESAFCGQGAFKHGLNLEGVSEMTDLMKLSSSGGHFIYDPKPSVAVIGKLRITIDGSTFYIPVCQ